LQREPASTVSMHGDVNRIAAALKRIGDIVRRIIGAPDYNTYVQHMARCHPDVVPMTARQFERQRLEDRYSRPGSRCC